MLPNNTGMPHPGPAPPAVILCTLNARYIHASLGLRYLLANMGELRSRTRMREFTIARNTDELAQELLMEFGEPAAGSAQVIGFGVYIWNVTQTCRLVARLRQLRPSLKIVLGGPEVSYELDNQPIVALADHVVTGWGDVTFPKLCRALLHGPRPVSKVLAGEQPPLEQIALPYAHYSATDLAHRVLYVEASRGCPFKCEFCLSSLDKTAWAFELERFLGALDDLYRRGARSYKFVDRTFNLKIEASLRILQFFLDRLAAERLAPPAPGLFVHFELIPDHLPDRLKEMIARFPAGVLQFEVGIQTFNPEVQRLISRRQDNALAMANLRWLLTESKAHLHTDLIFGLPGEDMQSFAEGFDRLYGLRPHEIQLGSLKRLRGTPIGRHSAQHGMVFDAFPPYAVRQTGVVAASDVLRFSRLARYWDLIANSGRFKCTLAFLLETADSAAASHSGAKPPRGGGSTSPFFALLLFTDWLWNRSKTTGGLAPEALVDYLFDYLSNERGVDPVHCRRLLLEDYVASGARGRPSALRDVLPKPATPMPIALRPLLPQRQQRHQAANRL